MFWRPQVDAIRGSTRSPVGPIGKARIPIARLIEPQYGSEREAALHIDNRVQLPTAHKFVRNTFDAAQERLPRTNRQFIDATQAKPISDIESGQTVISHPVFRVHDHADLSAGLSPGNR